MKVKPILHAINDCVSVHVCLAVFFAFCWFTHCAAWLKMEACERRFAVMNEGTLRTMALIDWIAANRGLVIAYVILAIGCVLFLQLRRRPSWTHWVTALTFCVPCLVYWRGCVHIMLKFL